MSTVNERARVSVQRLETVLMTAWLPFSSAIAIGVAVTPNRVGVHICNSGKARPIMSPSTSGMANSAATAKGIIEFRPPASADIVARAGRPR